jgi:hypothetical protein
MDEKRFNNKRTATAWLCACLFALAMVGSNAGGTKQTESVIKLDQIRGTDNRFEVLCTEQKLRVHSSKNGWTLITVAPMKELTVFKDSNQTLGRFSASSLNLVLPWHPAWEVPPLKQVNKSQTQGLSMTESDFATNDVSADLQEIHYLTLDRKNKVIGEILDALYDLPHRPGMPLSLTSKGMPRSMQIRASDVLMFEEKRKVEKVQKTWGLRTLSLKKIADNDNLWRLPQNYRPVEARDIFLGANWKDTADELSKGIFTKTEPTGKKIAK